MSTEHKNSESARKSNVPFNARQVLDQLNSEQLQQKLEGLSVISGITNKQVKQIPKEIVKAMVQLLKNSEKKVLTISILTAVKHLSTFKRTQLMLGEEGIIPAIFPYLSSIDQSVLKAALFALDELVAICM